MVTWRGVVSNGFRELSHGTIAILFNEPSMNHPDTGSDSVAHIIGINRRSPTQGQKQARRVPSTIHVESRARTLIMPIEQECTKSREASYTVFFVLKIDAPFAWRTKLGSPPGTPI